MMRAWKNNWSVPIGGLLIDTLAYQFIENYKYTEINHTSTTILCAVIFSIGWLTRVRQKLLEGTR